MPRGPLYSAASRRAKRAVSNLFPAFVLLLLGSAEASPSPTGPTASSQLRLIAPPLSLGENIRVFSTLSSHGNPYQNDGAGAVKRSAQLFFTGRQRTNVKRSDFLQSLEDQLLPWMLQGANQGLLSTHGAAEVAFGRTLFFGDVPHERALDAHFAMREEQGLPSLRLGSIRLTSPFLIPL